MSCKNTECSRWDRCKAKDVPRRTEAMIINDLTDELRDELDRDLLNEIMNYERMKMDFSEKVWAAMKEAGITEEQVFTALESIRVGNTYHFGQPFEVVARVETKGVSFGELSESA